MPVKSRKYGEQCPKFSIGCERDNLYDFRTSIEYIAHEARDFDSRVFWVAELNASKIRE